MRATTACQINNEGRAMTWWNMGILTGAFAVATDRIDVTTFIVGSCGIMAVAATIAVWRSFNRS